MVSVLHLTNSEVFFGKICEEIQITEILEAVKFCGMTRMTLHRMTIIATTCPFGQAKTWLPLHPDICYSEFNSSFAVGTKPMQKY